MQDRRQFFKTIGGGTAAGLFLGRSVFSEGPNQIPTIGLQTYTVRKQLEKDFAGTIRKIADLGIKDVEIADYYGAKPNEVRKILDDAGLRSFSAQISTETLRSGLEEACEGANIIGQRYLVLGWLPPEERRNLDDYNRLIENLNKGVEICQKFGIALGYHNHDFEFTEIDGKTPYHLIVTGTGSMALELDVYWVTKAGRDPFKMIKAHADRVRLLHLKDMTAGPEKDFAEVGSGVIDFKGILAQARESGVERCFIEQDETPGDPFDSVKTSLRYLKGIGY